MLLLIISIIIFILVIILLYFKIRFKFWSKQPVFHIYDILYWFKNPKIIKAELPTFNKYTNFVDIKTKDYMDISLNPVVELIQNNYLDEDTIQYKPTLENITPYLENHNYPVYISTYTDKNNLIGCLTSRPLNVILKNNKFAAYYVDYLVVKKGYRKRGVAPELIQTHEYNQRHNNKEIQISLFKREDTLTNIIPLVTYKLIGFPLYKFKSGYLHASLKLLKITKQNLHFVFYLIKSYVYKNFPCVILPDINNLAGLIESNNIIMYVVMQLDNIICLYVFQDTCVYHNKKKGIQLISSCCIDKDFNPVFEEGLYQILDKFKCDYQNVFIDVNSHNHILIERIINVNRSRPFLTSTAAYYFYNYIHRPFLPTEVFIIT